MRIEVRPRQTLVRCAVITALVTGLLASDAGISTRTYANPEVEAAATRAASDQERVTIDTGPPSLPADGSFTIRADVRVDEPTPYLEVRLQIHRPTGQLLFQRTEIRSDVETGTVTAEFERELADLSLSPDAYPYEIRVRTEVGEVREERVGGLLLLHPPDPDPTPISVVVRIAEMPGFDSTGHFVADPVDSESTLRQVSLLAGSVLDDPGVRLTLGIPGMTLDAWRRVADGYTHMGPGGQTEIEADEDLPRLHAETLQLLADAVATGRLELLDVPYADPDVGALAETGSLIDLGVHYEHSRSAYMAALETSPSAGTAVFGDALSPGALEVLKSRDVAWALMDPESLTANEATPTAGPWNIEGSPVRGLVLDRALSSRLASPEASLPLLCLFGHAISSEAGNPLVASLEIGPGDEGLTERILSLGTLLDQVPWAQAVTASEAADAPALGTAAPPARVVSSSPAPADYVQEVREARAHALALESAVGVDDPDSQAVTEGSLISQSRLWSGPDGSWTQADRGRSFASAALHQASSIFDQIALTAPDVTLAGSRGDLPLSVVNNSAKDLSVRLVMRSESVHLPRGGREAITLKPQENLHTVRVDLRSSLSGSIDIELWAGDLLLDSAAPTVRASYLDQLAIVGGVTLLLIGMLLYIRKRVRRADVDTMHVTEENEGA